MVLTSRVLSILCSAVRPLASAGAEQPHHFLRLHRVGINICWPTSNKQQLHLANLYQEGKTTDIKANRDHSTLHSNSPTCSTIVKQEQMQADRGCPRALRMSLPPPGAGLPGLMANLEAVQLGATQLLLWTHRPQPKLHCTTANVTAPVSIIRQKK